MLCAFTFAISAALIPSYGYPIHHAVNLYAEAGVVLTEVESGADITFVPMPPQSYPFDWGGVAMPGVVLLRAKLHPNYAFYPQWEENVRVNLVLHEIQHELGWTHETGIKPVTWEMPTVPTLGCKGA